ncbi:flagellar hook-length control protein FliK [Paracoccus beibuensis]|uniref:flagellar hook-length control protein FliK n=1 Tax=Paracoccus beibuensis TaxID=547602 RepID=UPI0022409CA1|nr:flagellar hook-length control protein FliK [Paracoccus beibuensis]
MSDVQVSLSPILVADAQSAQATPAPQGDSDFQVEETPLEAEPLRVATPDEGIFGRTFGEIGPDDGRADPLAAWLEGTMGLSAGFRPGAAAQDPTLPGLPTGAPVATSLQAEPATTDAGLQHLPSMEVAARVDQAEAAAAKPSTAEMTVAGIRFLPGTGETVPRADQAAVGAAEPASRGKAEGAGSPADLPTIAPGTAGMLDERQIKGKDIAGSIGHSVVADNRPAAPTRKIGGLSAATLIGGDTLAASDPAPQRASQPQDAALVAPEQIRSAADPRTPDTRQAPAPREAAVPSVQPLDVGLSPSDAAPADPILSDLQSLAPHRGSAVGVASTSGPAHDPRPVLQQVTEALVRTRGDSTEIALSPEELGRIRLVMSGPDRAHITVWAERPETLDLVRRNADLLAQHLAEAGVDAGSLDFRQDSGRGWQDDGPGRRGADDDEPYLAPAALVRLTPTTLSDRRLDIRL